jgi:hypothetical protein
MVLGTSRSCSRASAAVLCSVLLHAAIFFSLATRNRELALPFEIPDQIELGILGPEPGAGAPAPAAPAAKEPEPVEPPVRRPPAVADDGYRVVDAGTPQPAQAPAQTARSAIDSAIAEGEASPLDGNAGGGFGARLGFGSGGFGSGTGGPAGAVIGLHADLDQIRTTSLILEIRALLEIIPEWERLLAGSGLDALNDFSRVFVATPNLKRSGLVVSGRLKAGSTAIRDAAERLAHESGQHAQFQPADGLSISRWYNHGPTERSVALVGADQFVIARPDDVGRALAVSAALGQRQSHQSDMEKASGAGALLAMYEGEAAALSVEGVRGFIKGEASSYAPVGLRMSLRHVDEFNADLRIYGYYESPKLAASALPQIETVRTGLIDHPRINYLGMRSAVEEAQIVRAGDTITISTRMTLHQVRYLMAYVSGALKPRGD